MSSLSDEDRYFLDQVALRLRQAVNLETYYNQLHASSAELGHTAWSTLYKGKLAESISHINKGIALSQSNHAGQSSGAAVGRVTWGRGDRDYNEEQGVGRARKYKKMTAMEKRQVRSVMMNVLSGGVHVNQLVRVVC